MWKIYMFIATICIAEVASELNDFLGIRYCNVEDPNVYLEIKCSSGRGSDGKCEDGSYTITKETKNRPIYDTFKLNQEQDLDGEMVTHKAEGNVLTVVGGGENTRIQFSNEQVEVTTGGEKQTYKRVGEKA